MASRILSSLLVSALLVLSLGTDTSQAGSGITIIAHAGTPKLDASALKKLFMGRLVEIEGMNVTPVNQSSGSQVRSRFMQEVLGESDDKYIAYWTVRRYIGKGAPPKEFTSDADVINYVQSTPGAIGYITENNAKPGITVLLTR